MKRDHEVSVRGRLVRIAGLAADGYAFLDDPAEAIDGLQTQGRHIDLFTFAQEPPDTAPRYDYNEWPMRQGRRFKHDGKSLELVRRENATLLDRSVFLGAFVGDDLVGFAKVVTARRQAALMQILARDRAPGQGDDERVDRSRRPRVRAAARLVSSVYGRFSYGQSQADPLSDFKRHNGFQRIEVPRYYVPLSPVGRAALRLGLHHGLGAYVPQAVIDRVRNIRARWWARRSPVAKAAAP